MLARVTRAKTRAFVPGWCAPDIIPSAFDTNSTDCAGQGSAHGNRFPARRAAATRHDDVNCELDRLEGQLKLLFPSDAPRVASYLAVTDPNVPPRPMIRSHPRLRAKRLHRLIARLRRLIQAVGGLRQLRRPSRGRRLRGGLSPRYPGWPDRLSIPLCR